MLKFAQTSIIYTTLVYAKQNLFLNNIFLFYKQSFKNALLDIDNKLFLNQIKKFKTHINNVYMCFK
jgi:hypothetical protein